MTTLAHFPSFFLTFRLSLLIVIKVPHKLQNKLFIYLDVNFILS